MWPWTRRDITPVGVEFDGPAIRLAQIEFRSGQPPAVTLLSRELPGHTKAVGPHGHTQPPIDLLRRLLGEGGFVGRRVITRLPDQLVHLRTLRLAPGRSIGLDATVRLESRSVFPFPPEQLQLNYIEAGQTRYGAQVRDEVIVAASPRVEVERLLAEFHRAGLDLAGVELGPCAAYRACRWSTQDEREIHAVLEIGGPASHVVIGKAAQVRFIKRLAVGADHLAEAMSRRLGVSNEDGARIRRRFMTAAADAPDRQAIHRAAAQACRPLLESLAADVSACLRYYGVSFRGRAIDRLLVSGRDAADPQLGAVLSGALSVPVKVADPFSGFDTSSGPIREANEWSVALGLAMKYAGSAATSALPGPGRVAAPAVTAAAVQA